MKYFPGVQLVRSFKNKQEPESVNALADSYWHILLTIFAVLALTCVVYDVWQFSEVDRVISSAVASTPPPAIDTSPFDPKQLRRIVDGFAERQLTYQQYSTQMPTIADPSINPPAVKPRPTH